jgi:hypothetical protein
MAMDRLSKVQNQLDATIDQLQELKKQFTHFRQTIAQTSEWIAQ